VGIVHFFGTLLDPLMRPLFRVPGIGGFVITMGYASGYPVGARLTAQLWEQKLITRIEGERLVAVTTTSDPIFLTGAVAVGFFHNPSLALILAIAHYGGALLLGFALRWHDRKGEKRELTEWLATESHRTLNSDNNMTIRIGNSVIGGRIDTQQAHVSGIANASAPKGKIRLAIQVMHEARVRDGRRLGRLMLESLQSSLKLIIVVGGLVVFFSVIMELLGTIGVKTIIAEMLQFGLNLIGIPPDLAPAIVSGLFEVTLGAQASGATTGVALVHQVAICALILSWGGLSVHAQVISLLSATNLRYKPFVLARILHCIIAVVLVYVLWGWLGV
jgi:nucleoside recognition membrane protein YjiH